MYKIWVDEAWRWPWLWSVVACAMTFCNIEEIDSYFLSQITDSKKLTHKKREEIFNELIRLSKTPPAHSSFPPQQGGPKVYFWVGVVDNYLIDEINIKQANREAMRRALIELLRKIEKDKISGVFIDGNDNYKFDELWIKPVFIIWWDAKVLEIGAASIIAKVFRDKLTDTYWLLYPDLSIENHKWYGTKKHIDYLTDKSKITGIHRLSYKPVKKILDSKPKLLLHVCCGPDVTIPLVDLKNVYDITCFWYDPNIAPKKEYDKRLKAFKKVCEIEWVEFIEWEYNNADFLKNCIWFEFEAEKWERCRICYDMRLEITAQKAQELGISEYATTLTISPHKDTKKIFCIGDKLNKKYKSQFLKLDFKKNEGFKRSLDYCEVNDIYRQDYCGCPFSMRKKSSKI